MLETVLSVLQVFIAVILILLILLHSGKDAGMSGRVRRRHGRRFHRRLPDGAQPGPLDHLLRGRVRREHDRAAEDLATPRAQTTVSETVYLPLPTVSSFEPVSLNVAEPSCPESTCVTSSVISAPRPIASIEPNSSFEGEEQGLRLALLELDGVGLVAVAAGGRLDVHGVATDRVVRFGAGEGGRDFGFLAVSAAQMLRWLTGSCRAGGPDPLQQLRGRALHRLLGGSRTPPRRRCCRGAGSSR